MKKPKTPITTQLKPVINFVSKYKKFLFVLAILGTVLFLVIRINQLTTKEPTEAQISDKLQTVTRPKLDQSVLNRIQQLQDQNVEVKSLFDNARSNPFNE